MSGSKKVTEDKLRDHIAELADEPEGLRDYLDEVIPFLKGPVIKDISPRKDYAGAIVEIKGKNFSSKREENEVTVGGRPAIVVRASHNKLRAITDMKAATGPVEVKVGEKKAIGPFDFQVIDRLEMSGEGGGPPILFSGCNLVESEEKGPVGALNVLFILVSPSDRLPKNAAIARDKVVDKGEKISKFFMQASFERLDVKIDITAEWHELSGKMSDYVHLPTEDILCTSLDRLMAEGAHAASSEGLDLNRYDTIACILNLDGSFVRGRGGWSCQNFQHRGGSTCIDITLDHEINLMAIQESADWGRFVHELSHGIVSRPKSLSANCRSAVLSEDLYSTDLVDPTVATAQDFDMMGRHDHHPLFSGYYMSYLGWYRPENILELRWSPEPFSQEYEILAHGLKENDCKGRYHLIKIKVADGLSYFIEARQRPGRSDQIFDELLPAGEAADVGGMVVTKVLAGRMNINQQMRFITLMHEPRVLKGGEAATDPERSLKITALECTADQGQVVCKVRVEWSQKMSGDAKGDFDLHIEPWNDNWESPDIWIDRIPYGEYDEGLDEQGRPKGNGDKPRPLEINRIWARIRCDGVVDARDVRVTFYSIEPPNIGDNGNWAPIKTVTVSSVPAKGHKDACTGWVPVVGRQTAIKVWIEPQPGEIAGGNNYAQENVLKFEAPASSKPEPIAAEVSVCNPLDVKTTVLIKALDVPAGYIVHFPRSWIKLDPHEAWRCEAIVVPTRKSDEYSGKAACIKITGFISRDYAPVGDFMPGSKMVSIGGVQIKVSPKVRARISLGEDTEVLDRIAIVGSLDSRMEGERIRVDLIDPDDNLRAVQVKTDRAGNFRAEFDMDILPCVLCPYKSGAGAIVQGIFTAQAFLINSPKAADAESDVVLITR